jgi:hypothetical protein
MKTSWRLRHLQTGCPLFPAFYARPFVTSHVQVYALCEQQQLMLHASVTQLLKVLAPF